jgi:hypothetical protein
MFPGVDVPMDDQVLVRVMHGAADVFEKSKTFADVELALIAVRGDRRAVNVLHDEKRDAPVCDAAVQQLSNAVMLERRENLSLGEKATMQVVGIGACAEQFDRDALLILSIVALGEVDDAHAATAKLAYDAVCADAASALHAVEHSGRSGRRR